MQFGSAQVARLLDACGSPVGQGMPGAKCGSLEQVARQRTAWRSPEMFAGHGIGAKRMDAQHFLKIFLFLPGVSADPA
jgi:hypothetical protein